MTFPYVSIHPPSKTSAPLVDVARWFPPWKRCHKRPSPLHLDELPESEENSKLRKWKAWKSWIFSSFCSWKTLGITGVVKSADEFVFEEFSKRDRHLGPRRYKTNLKFPLELWTQDVSLHHPPKKNNATTPHLGGWSFSNRQFYVSLSFLPMELEVARL